jgi:hypothetical protein
VNVNSVAKSGGVSAEEKAANTIFGRTVSTIGNHSDAADRSVPPVTSSPSPPSERESTIAILLKIREDAAAGVRPQTMVLSGLRFLG